VTALAVAALIGVVGLAIVVWVPTFFVRVHRIDPSRAGLWIGLATAVGMIGGSLIAGPLADRLIARSRRAYFLLPAVSLLLAVPPAFIFLNATSLPVALASLALHYALICIWIPPLFSLVLALAPPDMRGAAAFFMTSTQYLLGIGLGPFLAGALSDQLAPVYGDAAIRYSLEIMLMLAVVAALLCWRAARIVERDLERMRDAAAAAGNPA
jgi:MFS family permease